MAFHSEIYRIRGHKTLRHAWIAALWDALESFVFAEAARSSQAIREKRGRSPARHHETRLYAVQARDAEAERGGDAGC